MGHSLLGKILPKTHLNHSGHHWIFKDVTNNLGELLACKYALQIALKEGIKKVFGDSNLILEAWSKGFIKSKNKSSDTINLVAEVKKYKRGMILKKKEEKWNIYLAQVNPADLGFHKNDGPITILPFYN